MHFVHGNYDATFLSTPSARRATHAVLQYRLEILISIHALREEGDARNPWTAKTVGKFLSTPSARRATPQKHHHQPGQPISIHALREEGDHMFSPQHAQRYVFLSTPSARRATACACCACAAHFYFYPRPPRGGRRWCRSGRSWQWSISIHALREEGDADTALDASQRADFYPRPPRGGRHCALFLFHNLIAISIHALREEGDGRIPASTRDHCNFYPRPPRGGRRPVGKTRCASWRFLSTPSARRATPPGGVSTVDTLISIHALREEGDYRPK